MSAACQPERALPGIRALTESIQVPVNVTISPSRIGANGLTRTGDMLPQTLDFLNTRQPEETRC